MESIDKRNMTFTNESLFIHSLPNVKVLENAAALDITFQVPTIPALTYTPHGAE